MTIVFYLLAVLLAAIEPRPIYSRSKNTPGKLTGWLARWYGPDGKQESHKCRTKTEARRWARDMESLRDAGRYPNERKRKPGEVPTVAEYAYAAEDERLTLMGASEAARKYEAARIRNRLENTSLGRMLIDAPRAKDVRAWLIELQHRGYGRKSIRESLATLRRVYDVAIEDDDLPTVEFSPAASRTIKAAGRPPASAPQMPTLEQLHALAARMPDNLRAMLYVQATLGLRLGELCALREQDIDFLRREVHITGQIRGYERQHRSDDLKTESSRRTILLPRLTELVLAEHMRNHERGADGLIFTSTYGSHARIVYGTALRAAADACAAADPTFPPHLVSHHLRHMAGSVSVAGGMPHADAAKRLGHKNTALLVGTYEHPMPDRDAAERALLDEAWGGEDAAVRAATGANVDPMWTRKQGNRT